MKKTIFSSAALCFTLGLVQTLAGQTPLLDRQHSPNFFHRADQTSKNSAQFSKNADGSTAVSKPHPDAGGVTPATFLSAMQIESDGSATYPVVSADFNGDGLPDVATVLQLGAPLLTYLAIQLNGVGLNFTSPILIPVSFDTGDLMIAADVNHDGKSDIVLVHSNSIDVFLSNGDGTFASPQTLATGISSPLAAAFWDVNRDGNLDVVIVDSESNQAAYLLGNGQGGFAQAQITPFPAQASVGILADVDADGNLDLVTNNTLYPGNGTGGFLAGILFQSADGENAGATFSNSIAAGDVNGDGLLDVVTANGNWNTVSVFLNQGGRKFVQSGPSIWSGNNPVALAIADVNWDGKPDLIVTNAAESDLSVLLGKGDGTFLTPTTEYAIGGAPTTRPVLADFNGDGDLDVVLSDNQSSLVLALGNGDGTYQAASVTNVVVPAGSSNAGGAISITSADFNGDGIPDFVLGQSATSPGLGLIVYLGQSSGRLAKGVIYARDAALSYVAVGDINKDGKADIVASNWATGGVDVLRGNGDGTFQSPAVTSLPGITNGLVVADFNGDGWPDVAAVGNGVVYVLLNNGQGSLALTGTYPISAAGYELVAADFNNDGKMDLAVAMTATSRVAILLGNGDGTFSSAPDYDTTLSSVYGIAAKDLDKDGSVDLVITSPTDGTFAVAFGHGDGTFGTPSIYGVTSMNSPLNPSPGEVFLADVNDDGQADIVYSETGYSAVGIYLGAGSRRFEGPFEFPTGGGSLGVAVANLNQNGWPAIVTADAHFSGVSVLYNTTAIQPAPDFTLIANPSTLQMSAGGTNSTTISLSSINSFIGSVQLSCQNLPSALSCVFTPSAVHVATGKGVTSQLTIGATQSAASAFAPKPGFLALAMIPLLGGMLFWRAPRNRAKLALVPILVGLTFLAGCQGLAPTTKKSSQNYTVSINALAWNGTSHSISVQVTVQQ